MFTSATRRLLRPRLTTISRLAPIRPLSYPHFKGPRGTINPYSSRAPQYPSKVVSTFTDDRIQQFGAAVVDTRNGVGELLHQVNLLNRTVRDMKRNFTILAILCTVGAVMVGALVGVILWIMIIEDLDEEEY